MTIIEQVVEAYFPGCSVRSEKPISGGLINQTFQVNLNDGREFIIQKVNSDVFSDIDAVHQNIRTVANHLEESGYRYEFPGPMNADDKSWIKTEDGTWRILSFVSKSYSVKNPTSMEMAHNAAKCLGHFHACTIDLDPEKLQITIPDFHSGALRIDQLKNAAGKSDQTEIGLVGEIYNHLHVLKDWDKINSETPTRIAHFDTKIENFLFKDGTDDVAALIDLDTIMPGSILSDVGDLIRSFCDEDLQNRDAILDGYLLEMEEHLTEHEKTFLKFSGSALTLMQAVRFLTDHLNGDNYYLTEYEGQNLDRAKQQFALYQRLNS